MYKIYYLTSEKDFNIPMYIGMTKLNLEQRLKNHLHKRNNYNKNNIWKNKRENKISIHLIETNFNNYKNCSISELFWINFWKNINPNLTNSITYALAEHPYKNSIENIKKNISEGVINKKCRNIVALDNNQKFLKTYRTIISASLDLKIKSELIINNLKNKTKSKKFIFIYEDEYNENINYSFKIFDFKKRKPAYKKAEVSINCRNSVKKSVTIKNCKTNDIIQFESKTEASKFLGFSSSYFDRVKNKGIEKNNYLIL